jgi:DNA-binding NtrC family response regulator
MEVVKIPRILVVDDDAELARLAADVARRAGFDAMVANDARAATRLIESEPFDLVVTDVRMPEIGGIELVEWIKKHDPRIAVIAITAFGSVDSAVRAVRAGAFDYLQKPFEPKALALSIERALEARQVRLELSSLRSQVEGRFSTRGIIGASQAMKDVVALVQRVADSECNVIITGPSGAGKELVAKALHQESKRRSRAFIAVNCAAIPDTLLESELFGVKRGAFTDARADRLGMFQEADGGTMFFDEIAELALPLQAKLLRALQEREVRSVGATKPEPVDVRVVAATNRDLRERVAQGAFREDLYYRLAVIEIAIPSLADRREDILPLAEHFVERESARAGRPLLRLSGATAAKLLGYGWPGNIRELENVIARGVALARSEVISPDDLPVWVQVSEAPDFLASAAERGMTIDELSRAYARLVLQRFGGKKKRAAQVLGVDRRTLQRWFGGEAEERDTAESIAPSRDSVPEGLLIPWGISQRGGPPRARRRAGGARRTGGMPRGRGAQGRGADRAGRATPRRARVARRAGRRGRAGRSSRRRRSSGGASTR